MAVTIRFHGRFVYAKRDGGFSVLAPNFDPPFAPHRALMSIPFDQLKFFDNSNGGHKQITTLHPMLRIATGGDVPTPQVLVWDLSGLHVSYSGSPQPATLAGDAKVPELTTLEEARKGPTPKLAASAHRADTRGRTCAVIDVIAGEGSGITPLEDDAKFVKGGEARQADMAAKGVPGIAAPTLSFARDPKNPTADLKAVLAESVDFSVTSGEKVEDDPVLTLTFANASGEPVGRVTVRDDSVVAFSNLCAPLHEPGDHDLEFSQYYNLLEASPGADGLVPTFPAALSEAFPCVGAASI